MIQADERCAPLSLAAGEPLAGTAPVADTWVVLEQSGPWGRKALRESHMDSEVARALDEWSQVPGLKLLLARRPGKHSDDHHIHERRFWIGHVRPGQQWLRTGSLTNPLDLTQLDPAGLAAGVEPELGEPARHGYAFVCAHSKRDTCCALHGRAVIADLAARAIDDSIWECSHLGGHRFSATAVVLPSGLVLGRADADHVEFALSKGVPLDALRGRSCWPPAAQAAELAVRRTLPDPQELDDVVVDHTERLAPTGGALDAWSVTLSGPVGRWVAQVETRPASTEHPSSCGDQPWAVPHFVVTEVRPVP